MKKTIWLQEEQRDHIFSYLSHSNCLISTDEFIETRYYPGLCLRNYNAYHRVIIAHGCIGQIKIGSLAKAYRFCEQLHPHKLLPIGLLEKPEEICSHTTLSLAGSSEKLYFYSESVLQLEELLAAHGVKKLFSLSVTRYATRIDNLRITIDEIKNVQSQLTLSSRSKEEIAEFLSIFTQ